MAVTSVRIGVAVIVHAHLLLKSIVLKQFPFRLQTQMFDACWAFFFENDIVVLLINQIIDFATIFR